MKALPATALMRPCEVYRQIGLGKTAFYTRIRVDPTFPRPVVVPGGTRQFYRRAEIEAWLANLGNPDDEPPAA